MKIKSKYAPLPSSTLLIAIFGFFISIVYVIKYWPSFGFAFSVVFVMMFFASFVSLMKANPDDIKLIDEYEKSHKGGILKESALEKRIEKFLGIGPKNTKKN